MIDAQNPLRKGKPFIVRNYARQKIESANLSALKEIKLKFIFQYIMRNLFNLSMQKSYI